MIVGNLVWQQEEVRKGDISIALIIREHFSACELFPYCHRRRNWCISWQLVDPFEFCGFRHDADKASTWFQRSVVDIVSPQESGGQSLSLKLAKLFLLVVAMARFLVASLFWDITTTMDLTLIERGNLRQSVNRLFICGMSLTKNLVQNYSDHFGNSQRSSLSPTVSVKSTSPVTENNYKNGYENCIYSMNNINMSDEDNNHDTNCINKHKYANHDTRKLHLWARHVERAVSVCLDVVSYTLHWLKFLESSLHPIFMHVWFSLISPSSLPTSTWPSPSSSTPLSWCTSAAHRPRQLEHRGTQPAQLGEGEPWHLRRHCLPHRMRIQSSLYFQQWIDTWRSRFEQKTDSILLAHWSKRQKS